MTEDYKDLFYLEELPDYKVASDYPDVRGWDVVDAGNRTIGKVTNLVVSKKDERVVYLDVEVDNALIEACYDTRQAPAGGGERGLLTEVEDHLIIPVEMVSLDEDREKVVTGRIGYNTFAGARRFRKGAAIDRGYEAALLRHYRGEDTTGVGP